MRKCGGTIREDDVLRMLKSPPKPHAPLKARKTKPSHPAMANLDSDAWPKFEALGIRRRIIDYTNLGRSAFGSLGLHPGARRQSKACQEFGK